MKWNVARVQFNIYSAILQNSHLTEQKEIDENAHFPVAKCDVCLCVANNRTEWMIRNNVIETRRAMREKSWCDGIFALKMESSSSNRNHHLRHNAHIKNNNSTCVCFFFLPAIRPHIALYTVSSLHTIKESQI